MILASKKKYLEPSSIFSFGVQAREMMCKRGMIVIPIKQP
jgi:hypothetical protein